MTTATPRRRVSVASALALLTAMAVPAEAQACRCAPKPLAAYYEQADHVFTARVHARHPVGDAPLTRLDLAVDSPAYKGRPGSVREYLTTNSSASCGVNTPAGTRLVVFARSDPDAPHRAHVNTCDGTRPLAPDAGQGDFEDVPAAAVESALAQLGGRSHSPVDRTPGKPGARSIIGLATVPALTAGTPAERSPVALYARSRGTCGRRLVLTADELVMREIGYEQPAAVVHEVRDGRYRVSPVDGDRLAAAWLPREYVGDYRPLARLLPDRLTYLTASWDGLLWPHPQAGEPRRPATQAETLVEVLGSLRAGAGLWLQVRLLAGNPCEGDEPTHLDIGWVPAWNDDGEPTVWFWSRGC